MRIVEKDKSLNLVEVRNLAVGDTFRHPTDLSCWLVLEISLAVQIKTMPGYRLCLCLNSNIVSNFNETYPVSRVDVEVVVK